MWRVFLGATYRKMSSYPLEWQRQDASIWQVLFRVIDLACTDISAAGCLKCCPLPRLCNDGNGITLQHYFERYDCDEYNVLHHIIKSTIITFLFVASIDCWSVCKLLHIAFAPAESSLGVQVHLWPCPRGSGGHERWQFGRWYHKWPEIDGSTLIYQINVRTGTITEFWEKTLIDVLWLFFSRKNYFNWLPWFLALCAK